MDKMTSSDPPLVFGPVPSRRLGQSVGINNIPPKICTYSCIYCQLGTCAPVAPQRQYFYDPGLILAQTREKLKKARLNHESIDYLTIVSDGEPTLDNSLGQLISDLTGLGLKTAVITNASLLGLSDVRRDLCLADWVSVKIDTLDQKIWRKMNRPDKNICFREILNGIESFSREFNGSLVTETMLILGKNDNAASLEDTAEFISTLTPCVSYLSIPTRPPAVKSVRPPQEETLNSAWQIFSSKGINAEFLIGYEGNQFAFTGDVQNDILSITAVHPMREDAVMAYLKKAGSDFTVIDTLIKEKKIIIKKYGKERFFMRLLNN
jgi:wyosine [tRNA(Phe)-imidazoG37] synthetase (radical SAM superfamily)